MQFLIAVLIGLLLYLNAQLWLFDERGLPYMRHLETQVAAQQAENARLAERNDALDADVRSLKAGLEAIEERARVELGMIRKDETFFRIIEPSRE